MNEQKNNMPLDDLMRETFSADVPPEVRKNIMKTIRFEFVGERLPELAGLEPRERRKRYLAAARRSYLRIKTWIGLVLFLVLLINAETLAKAIYFILDKTLFDEKQITTILRCLISLAAWICLGGCQVSAIRDELRKQIRAKLPANME